MKDISRTLVVGLGGTGQTVIREIKKRLLRSYGEIPKLVRFLEFDTDENNTKGGAYEYYYDGKTYQDFKYQIQNSEFLLTPFYGVGLAEKDPICNEKIRIEELSKVSHRLNGKGAGGYRVCGRTIFLQNAEKIIKALRNTISGKSGLRDTSLTNNEIANGYNLVNGGNINVFVIASLAGGTGSSSFMDMSRMLQIAGIKVDNKEGMGKDQIFGMFFLPKFFEGKPHTQNIRVNAYTALSELDYTWGLNDGSKYKEGCRDLALDVQDYPGQGGHTKKRVVFTSVCLIDALTTKNQVNSFPEAASHVASFVAASIAADNNAIISSFANSNHKLQTVDGKYQNYSGIGYCELRFNRQDLVKYLLNRKLIAVLEDYKNGINDRANEIAEKFIKENSLDEGVQRNSEDLDTRDQLNELTDAIINMSDKRFGSVYMNAVDTSDNADSLIETNKIQYLNDIATLAQTMVNEYSRRKEQVLANLRTLLSKYQCSNGFGQFPDIARQLKTSFVAMMEGLIAEKKRHADEFLAIENELSAIKNSIKDNNPGGPWGRGHRRQRQSSLLDVYSNKVRFEMGDSNNPTLARLKVEDIRKTEAVSLYERMIQLVDEFYKAERKTSIDGPKKEQSGSFLKVEGMYESLMETLTLENDSYKPSQAAVKETLYADAYFKDHFEQHDKDAMPLSEHAINELNKYFKDVFTEQSTINSEKLVEMRQKLLNLLPADGLIKKIQENRMSIDEVFLECYHPYGEIENPNDLDKNPQLKMLQQLESMFDPLWNHLPFVEGLPPENNMIVGVYDVDNHIFTDKNGYAETINGWNKGQREYVGLGDPDRIVFMLMETAIPAHRIADVSDWADEYNLSNTYTFSDKRLEGIEMAMPGAQDESEVAWAYGWLFGLISNPKNRKALRVKPSFDFSKKRKYVTENNGDVNYFRIERSRDIAACHQKFINDHELAMDILNQAMDILDSNPVDNIIKIKEWVNERKMWSAEVRGKQEESLTDEEREVIQNEIAFLAKRFPRLGADYGVELRNGRVVHSDSVVLSRREAELKGQ